MNTHIECAFCGDIQRANGTDVAICVRKEGEHEGRWASGCQLVGMVRRLIEVTIQHLLLCTPVGSLPQPSSGELALFRLSHLLRICSGVCSGGLVYHGAAWWVACRMHTLMHRYTRQEYVKLLDDG